MSDGYVYSSVALLLDTAHAHQYTACSGRHTSQSLVLTSTTGHSIPPIPSSSGHVADVAAWAAEGRRGRLGGRRGKGRFLRPW
eukprot:4991797-Alexandrium_andersonii.AAC.1